MEAVELYAGPLLEGCSEPWVFQDRELREQEFLAALEILAREAIADGNAGDAARYLRRIISTDPLREADNRTLMEVLARNRNVAAVTQVYRELRRYLHRELN